MGIDFIIKNYVSKYVKTRTLTFWVPFSLRSYARDKHYDLVSIWTLQLFYDFSVIMHEHDQINILGSVTIHIDLQVAKVHPYMCWSE